MAATVAIDSTDTMRKNAPKLPRKTTPEAIRTKRVMKWTESRREATVVINKGYPVPLVLLPTAGVRLVIRNG